MAVKTLMTDETGLLIAEAIREKAKLEDRVTELEKNKVDKSSIAQTTGTAEDKVMSQKAVTEELEKKFDESNVVQSTGDAEDKVMSQAAATKEFAQLSEEIANVNGDLDEQNRIHSLNLHNSDTDLKGYLINDDGSLLAYAEYTTTDFIKVESGKTYYRSRIAGGGLDSYYDSNKKFIRRLTSDELGSKSFTIQNGVKYIRISRYASLTGIFDLYTEDVNETIPYQLTLDDDVKVKYDNLVNVPRSIKDICSIDGKNILVMGDSIFGQVNDDTGVCANIKEKTNANIINCAFGGTLASGRSEVNGYQAFDFYYLVDALVSGDYSTQNSAVSQGSLPSYYGDKLNILKSLDWSSIDIVTMNYGTNDFTYGTGTARYRSRYKESLGKLLMAYPNLKVIIITPTYRLWLNNGEFDEDSNTHKVVDFTLLDYIAELKDTVCKDLNLPCIDLYNIGINQYNWNQYFASGDTTHQNEYGRNYIADIVSKKLCSM